nr:EbhA [uncultured Streptococcus sp.]
MKKKIMILSMCLIIGISGLGYYFLSYAPHQAAVTKFEDVVKDLNEKNKEVEDQIAEAEKVVDNDEEPLDSKTLEELKSTIKDSKDSLRKVPEMEKATAKIEKQIEELSQPLDYSETKKNLSEKLIHYQNSILQLKQITNPSSSFIEERLKEIESITGVQSVTEDNDPNKKLNKQGGYTASVYFVDKQVNESVEGSDIVQKGNDVGGNIEVYKTKEDAEKRNTYISAFDGTALNPGSHYVYGTVLIRTSHYLTGTQQKELTEKIYNKLIELK